MLQNGLSSALESLGGRDEPPEQPRAWLFQIVRRRLYDHLRKIHRQPAVTELIEAEQVPFRGGRRSVAAERWDGDPARAAQKQEFWTAFDQCLDAMPPLMRQAIVLREIDGEESETVCQMLDITRANLWTLIHRARLRLRKELGDYLKDP